MSTIVTPTQDEDRINQLTVFLAFGVGTGLGAFASSGQIQTVLAGVAIASLLPATVLICLEIYADIL